MEPTLIQLFFTVIKLSFQKPQQGKKVSCLLLINIKIIKFKKIYRICKIEQKIYNLIFYKLQNKQTSFFLLEMHKQSSKPKNPLLVKDQQGKVKQSTYNLPTGNYTYGKKVVDDPQPIKYVVNGWKEAQPSPDPPSKQKNYQELNKISIRNGAITAKDQQQFRKTNNIMVQTKKGQKNMPIMLPEQEFTYGVPNRPSTPVKLVIGNCYGLQKQQQNNEKYMRETLRKQEQKNKKLQAHKTKAQILRQQKAQQQKNYRQKPNIQEKFKLSKYTQNSMAKVDTRLDAFGVNNSKVENSQISQGNQ